MLQCVLVFTTVDFPSAGPLGVHLYRLAYCCEQLVLGPVEEKHADMDIAVKTEN